MVQDPDLFTVGSSSCRGRQEIQCALRKYFGPWQSLFGNGMPPVRGDPARIATSAGPWLSGASFVVYIARATNPAYTATQFALFTSLAAVPRTFVNATTGWLVESIGWLNFFWLCAALAVPGMLLLVKVAPWGDGPPSPTGGTSGARP